MNKLIEVFFKQYRKLFNKEGEPRGGCLAFSVFLLFFVFFSGLMQFTSVIYYFLNDLLQWHGFFSRVVGVFLIISSIGIFLRFMPVFVIFFFLSVYIGAYADGWPLWLMIMLNIGPLMLVLFYCLEAKRVSFKTEREYKTYQR